MEIPKLEGYISVSEAAKILKLSPQMVHNMIQSGKLHAKAIGEKPIFILLQDEVEEVAAAREDAAAEAIERRATRDHARARKQADGRPMLEFMVGSANVESRDVCNPETGYHSTPHRGCILR